MSTPEASAGSESRPEQRASGGQKSRRRTARLAVLSAVLSALLVLLITERGPLESLELKTYDIRFLLEPHHAPPSDIILVFIDEKTDAQLTDPRIFWQPHFTRLLRAFQTGGAKAVGIDVFFAIPVDRWLPDADRELAATYGEVSATVPVVLSYDNLQAGSSGLPLYMIASATGGTGFASLTLDRDGFVRRQELVAGSGQASSFAARLASVLEDHAAPVPVPSGGRLQVGGRQITLDRSGFMPIHFWGPGGTFSSVSMVDVLEAAKAGNAAQLAQWFRDKTVLVGSKDLNDTHPTPFYLRQEGVWGTYGIEIQASVLATIRQGLFLRYAPPWITPILVLAISVLAVAAVFRLGFPLSPLLLAGVGTLYCLVALVAQWSGFVLPVVPPVLAIVLGTTAAYGVYATTERRRRNLLQGIFGRYVSTEVARELLDADEVPLHGTRRVITVMFTDLRNYTAYCEGRDPQQVVDELNEYFADVTGEVKRHGGMVNKFIGDGIMALFGAPVAHADHAARAVRCALRLVERNDEFNRSRTERDLLPLVIGIGLHTGEAIIGNIGTAEKIEYTAIGATVNVAARIEGENKALKSKLLISQATLDCLGDEFVVESAGSAGLKGVARPVPLYRVRRKNGAANGGAAAVQGGAS